MSVAAQTAILLGYKIIDSFGGDAFYIEGPHKLLIKRSSDSIQMWERSKGHREIDALGSRFVRLDMIKRYGIVV